MTIALPNQEKLFDHRISMSSKVRVNQPKILGEAEESLPACSASVTQRHALRVCAQHVLTA